MENKIITKPSVFNLACASFVSIIMEKFASKKFILPSQVGSYKLLFPVIKEKPYKKNEDISIHNKFAIGIYRKGNKKYFIKTWQGKIKNIEYYDLVNEYRANKTLYEAICSETIGKDAIIIPKAIEYIQTNNNFSVVFEYVEGKLLAYATIKKQAEVTEKIYSLLSKISLNLKEKQRNELNKKGLSFYLLSLPYIVFLSIISNPGHTKNILLVGYKCIKSAFNVKSFNLTLAHRDLIPDNIFITDKNIILLDCEKVTLTIPGYDISYLGTMAGLQDIYKSLIKKTKYTYTEFLTNYIAIQYGRTDLILRKI